MGMSCIAFLRDDAIGVARHDSTAKRSSRCASQSPLHLPEHLPQLPHRRPRAPGAERPDVGVAEALDEWIFIGDDRIGHEGSFDGQGAANDSDGITPGTSYSQMSARPSSTMHAAARPPAPTVTVTGRQAAGRSPTRSSAPATSVAMRSDSSMPSWVSRSSLERSVSPSMNGMT